MDPTELSKAIGSSMSPGSLFGNLLFGLIGTAAFIYGRKSERIAPCVIGVLLAVYPYFISGLWLLYGVGAALVAALYVFRDQ